MKPTTFQKFNTTQFCQILMQDNIKQRLQPFIKEFKNKNIPFIYQSIVCIMQVLDKNETPSMRSNALMATKLFIQTSQYTPIALVQIYLLPIILEIANYSNSQKDISLYWINKGEESNLLTQQIEHIIVLLAIQLIYMTAAIKPYGTLGNFELTQESKYVQAKKTLIKNCINSHKTYTFFNQSQIIEVRRHYLTKLNLFNGEQYAHFFTKLICDEINNNIKPDLQSRKLFLYRDAFLTVPLLDTCEEELSTMETNFYNKIKYLHLIDDFIQQGDIYAILIVTKCQFLHNIYKQIQKVKGQVSLQEGAHIYRHVQASSIDKQFFYNQFLKCINIWAICHPFNEKGEPTEPNRIYSILKNQKHFIFPLDNEVDKAKSKIQINLKRNQGRNQMFIKIINDQHFNCDINKKKIEQTSEIANDSIKRVLLKTQLNQGQKMIIQAKLTFPLLMQKKNLPQNMEKIQKYKHFWQRKIKENQQQEYQNSQENLCIKIIEIILSAYNLYHQAKISFEDYQDRIKLVLETKDNIRSETSFQNKLVLQEKHYCHSQIHPVSKNNVLQNQSPSFKSYQRDIEMQYYTETKKESQSAKSFKSSINSSLNYKSSTKTKMKNKISGSPKIHDSSYLQDIIDYKICNKTKQQFNEVNYGTNQDYYGSKQSSNIQIYQSNQQLPVKIKDKSSLKHTFSASKRWQYKTDSSQIRLPSQSPSLQSYHQNLNMQTSIDSNKASLFRNCLQVNHQMICSQQRNKKLMKYSKDGDLINIIGNTSPKFKRESKNIHSMLNENKLIEKYESLHQNSIQTEILCSKIKSLSLLDKQKRIKMALRQNKGQTKKIIGCQESVNIQKCLKTRILSNSIYFHCFPDNKQAKIKKAILMSKSVIVKNTQFEIGCISSKKEKYLEISFFITPLKDSIEDIKIEVINSQNIMVFAHTKQIEKIKVNCQQRIVIQCSLQNVPYMMPIFTFNYKYQRDYQRHHLLITIPCGFNKFVNYQSISKYDWDMLNNNNFEARISTVKFMYNSKILGRQKIKESLNNFTFIGREKGASYFICEAYYKNSKFLLQVILNERGTMHLEGIYMKDNNRDLTSLQFLLATFKYIFEEQTKSH